MIKLIYPPVGKIVKVPNDRVDIYLASGFVRLPEDSVETIDAVNKTETKRKRGRPPKNPKG